LAAFPVPEARIVERAAFFHAVANGLIKDGVLPEDRLILRGGRLDMLARGYFLLNEAYKAWRIAPGHFTEEPKIAALQSMAIMTFVPFTPVDPTGARTLEEARPNEIYALACAAAVMGTEIDGRRPDFYLRLLDVISATRCHSLEPYVVDLNMQINRDLGDYRLVILSADHLPINSLITIFEMLSGRYE
jgi:hypothetical protein